MRQEAIETKQVGKYLVKVFYDEWCDSPRDMCDNIDTIYSNHRHYDPDGHSIDEILDENDNLSKDFLDSHIWIKVRGYEHSGMTISTSGGYPYNDPWDSGLFGIIAMSKDHAIKNFGGKKICTKQVKERALAYMESNIKVLDSYLQGECYVFEILDENGECIDSCGGFIGDIDYALQAALEDAKYYVERDEKKAVEFWAENAD